MAFFSYLDMQDYVKAYKLEKGTHHQFQQAVRKLSSNLPLVSGETESLNLLRYRPGVYAPFGYVESYSVKASASDLQQFCSVKYSG